MEHNCNRIIPVLIVLVSTITRMSSVNGRELRPSDHGLAYQDSNSTKDMHNFFNGQTTPKPLPLAAKNVTELSSSSSPNDGRSSNNGGGDHVRVVLLLASLVCGVIGVALLLTSVLVFLFRYRNNSKQKEQLPLQEEQEHEQAPTDELVTASS